MALSEAPCYKAQTYSIDRPTKYDKISSLNTSIAVFPSILHIEEVSYLWISLVADTYHY